MYFYFPAEEIVWTSDYKQQYLVRMFECHF